MEPEKPKRTKAPAKKTSRTVVDKTKAAKAPAGPVETKASRPPAGKATPKAAAKRPVAGRLKIPALLREGDRPSAPPPSGPGSRYALGPIAGADLLAPSPELPEAYGTRRLLLTARDPHWIYAHWDFTADQLKAANAASRDGHLVLRVFKGTPAGKPVVEQHVHPESRNWFVHVPVAGTRYVAELGSYDKAGAWTALSTSSSTLTPPDALSSDTSVRFETIPVDVPFEKLLELVKSAVAEHVPLVEAIAQLRAEGFTALPAPEQVATAAWTPTQDRALAEVINIDSVRRVWMGSLEITELIRRKLEQEISSQSAAAIARGAQFESAAGPGGIFSVSSPFGGMEKQRSFWFNVNAEVIVYGATEPGATVTIGGRRIQLRPDGTFSFRFALPDGEYQLPIAATSEDAVETRSAELGFSRETVYSGDVAAHPQDPALKPPRVEHVR